MYDLSKFLEAKNQLAVELNKAQHYIKDKKNLIEDRWVVYLSIEEYLPNSNDHFYIKSNKRKFRDTFKSSEICWFEDMHSEDHQSYTFSEAIDMLCEHACYTNKDLNIDDVNEFEFFGDVIEEMLQSGDGGFTVTW